MWSQTIMMSKYWGQNLLNSSYLYEKDNVIVFLSQRFYEVVLKL